MERFDFLGCSQPPFGRESAMLSLATGRIFEHFLIFLANTNWTTLEFLSFLLQQHIYMVCFDLDSRSSLLLTLIEKIFKIIVNIKFI